MSMGIGVLLGWFALTKKALVCLVVQSSTGAIWFPNGHICQWGAHVITRAPAREARVVAPRLLAAENLDDFFEAWGKWM